MDEWNIKTPNPICRLFFKIDLLTDFAAMCLTDFIDWRYIYSLVCIFDPGCELLLPRMKEQYLCTVAPLLYLLSDLPLPLPKLNVHCIQTVCVTLRVMNRLVTGRGGEDVSLCWVRSHAPSIRSYRGTKVVWPDFQRIRVPVQPVCIDLFRQNPVFTSLQLKSLVHVVQPL